MLKNAYLPGGSSTIILYQFLISSIKKLNILIFFFMIVTYN